MKPSLFSTAVILLLSSCCTSPAYAANGMEGAAQKLKSPEWDVRWQAIQELERYRDIRNIDALVEACNDPVIDIREKASVALANIGKAAVPKLVKALDDPRENVVICASTGLGRIKDPAAVDPLIRALGKSDPRIRESAVASLGSFNDPRANDAILRLVKDPDEKVREKALEAIGGLRDPRAVDSLILGLKSKNEQVSSNAYRSLLALDPAAVPSLLNLIAEQDEEGKKAVQKHKLDTGKTSLYYRDTSGLRARQRAIEILGSMRSPEAISGLVRLLSSDNQERCENVTWKLQQIGAPAIDPLIAALNSPDPRVRQSAASVLGNLHAEQAVGRLQKLLKDKDPNVRGSAAAALGSFKSIPVFESIMPLLQDKDETVRANVLDGLNKMGYPWLLEVYIGALNDSSPKVRLKAVTILRQLHDLRIVRAMEAGVKDPAPEVRAAALSALYDRATREQETAAAVSVIQDPSPKVRLVAIGLLARNLHTREGLDAAFIALRDTDPEVRKRSANTLVYGYDIDPRVVEPFLSSLVKEKDPEMLELLVAFINRYNIRDARAVEPIFPLLKNEKDHIRSSSAQALGTLNDKRALGPLAELLKDHYSTVQDRAVYALRSIYPRFPEALLKPVIENRMKALLHSDPRVRSSAAYSLGLMKETRAVPLLIDGLDDRDRDMREHAFDALGEIGDRRATKPFLAVMKKHQSERYDDETWREQGYAERALKKMKDPDAIGPLLQIMRDPKSKRGHDAGNILVEIGEPAVLPLIAELNDRSNGARVLSAFALGRIRDPRGVAPLINAFREKGDTIYQQIFVDMGSVAVPALCSLAKDDSVAIRHQAVQILGKIGDPRAVETLLAMTGDKDTNVRFSAAYALGSFREPRAIEPLLNLLKDAQLGHMAGAALKRIGAPAVEPLTTAMRKGDPVVRRNAVALPETGSNRLFAPVFYLGLQDKDRDVRYATLRALSDYGKAVADMDIRLEKLLPALKDPDPQLRNEAARIVGFYKSRLVIAPLCQVLSDRERYVRLTAEEALKKVDHPDAERCIQEHAPKPIATTTEQRTR